MSASLKPSMSADRSYYTSIAYKPRHQSWPYSPSDFARHDESSDTHFYGSPRLVNHIDDDAIASLRKYYAIVLPSSGRIIDFCSSWVSHYPARIEDGTKAGKIAIVGMGMNSRELDANRLLNAGRILQDLNENPMIPAEVRSKKGEKLDAATCVVSIDYLIKPVEVLRSLKENIKPGGTVHLIVSNRCFPTKAVSRWLRVTETERLLMVADYLHFAGWNNIEILDLKSADQPNGEKSQDQGAQRGLQDVMHMMGMSGSDPLWVVRGTN